MVPTQRPRGQDREEDGITGPISLKDLALNKRFIGSFANFSPNLLVRLSECKGLWLSKEIGEQDPVVVGW
jgi:hypothetical protein